MGRIKPPLGAKKTGPRNQLGQPATRTPSETIARLQEKVSRTQGGVNRKRIRAQISEERRARKDA